MQLPESWLRDWANPDMDGHALAELLTMAGLEVEEADPFAPVFTGVVVARIESIEPHPDADRLRICRVNDGSGEPLQIVCGAPNAAAGMLAPLARVGAVLPDGMRIKKARMRGVESLGMLCSARELGLSQDHDGLLALRGELTPGTDLRQALQLDDLIYTMKLTPNRADCLSVLGVAREISALAACPLKTPVVPTIPVSIEDTLPIDVQAPDLCGRFAGRIVRGVNARAATPAWMKERLERAGQRSVSALVDISNYVMLELGRPTHVFDLQKIRGGLTVRWARAGETLKLLNGQTVELQPDTGVICSEQAVESMAGIMGGDATAVTLDTTDVFLEAAFWWPEAIMGRMRQYRLVSEAGHRFERGVDYSTIAEHLDIMTGLLLDICGGQAGPLTDQTLVLPERLPVQMRLARCQRVLGMPLQASDVASVFQRLGLEFSQSGDVFTVVPPAARFDLAIEEDLIEEVARVHGFDRIPARPPLAPAVMRVPAEQTRGAHALRHAMAALDYQEVINFSFVEEAWERNYAGNDDPIRLLNPIASQLAVMRSSLIGGLLANIAHNASHRASRVRVFELGRVFWRDSSVADGDMTVAGVAQPLRLAAAAWGPAQPEQWGSASRKIDFFDVKNDLQTLLGKRADALRCVAAEHPALHPGRSARLLLEGHDLGWLGEIHPRWVQALELPSAPIVFECDLELLQSLPFPAPQRLSRQPVVVRDLAIWLDLATPWQSVLDTLHAEISREESLAFVKDIKLFDIWHPAKAPGQASPEVAANQHQQHSLALRIWFQGQDSTLEDSQIEQGMQQLMKALAQAHGARLRT